jgi:putative ABC transport system substrate-binding protein
VAVRGAPVQSDSEIETMMAALAHEERGGLLVINEAFTNAHRDAIIALAARYRLPAVYPFRFFAVAGGLMSYGIDLNDVFRRLGDYINRILAGAKPSDLPVQNPTKFELVTLGITIPSALLATADEVIE